MNKTEFSTCLAQRLGTLPQSEIEKSQTFYSEAIEDRIEDGMSEEEAVAAMGDMDEVAKNSMLDMPLSTLMKAKMKPKNGLNAGSIALIVLGFPLWFPLLIVFFAVIFVIYVSIWIVLASIWIADLSMIFAGVAGMLGSFFLFFKNSLSGMFVLGCSFASIGLGILLFFAIKQLSVLLIEFTTWYGRKIKSLFIDRGDNR